MSVSVLRLGHRIFRDQRITTHVFLTARAFGAREGFYTGQQDREMEESVRKLCEDFGGDFSVSYQKSWRAFLEKWKKQKGKIAHLTVYGIPFGKNLKNIKTKKLLVVVGGEKVPSEIYKMADWNLAVGSQPFSEVAALAVFIYEYNKRKIPKNFRKATLKIIPQERGKKVLKK